MGIILFVIERYMDLVVYRNCRFFVRLFGIAL